MTFAGSLSTRSIIRRCFGSSVSIPLCCFDYRVGISAYSPTDGHEFRNVESSFPKLEFRHKCLTLSEAFPKLYLRDAGVLASLHKQFDHSLIEVGTK